MNTNFQNWIDSNLRRIALQEELQARMNNDPRYAATKKLIQAKKAIYAAKGSPVSAPDSEARKAIRSKIAAFNS